MTEVRPQICLLSGPLEKMFVDFRKDVIVELNLVSMSMECLWDAKMR